MTDCCPLLASQDQLECTQTHNNEGMRKLRGGIYFTPLLHCHHQSSLSIVLISVSISISPLGGGRFFILSLNPSSHSILPDHIFPPTSCNSFLHSDFTGSGSILRLNTLRWLYLSQFLSLSLSAENGCFTASNVCQILPHSDLVYDCCKHIHVLLGNCSCYSASRAFEEVGQFGRRAGGGIDIPQWSAAHE